MAYNNNKRERRWTVPNKRADQYAKEIKKKRHLAGPKAGEELTPIEIGTRLGYLQDQNDHAGIYKYTNALKQGKSKEEAREISRTIGKGRK